MKVVGFKKPGSPEVLRVEEVLKPKLKTQDIMIQVAAVGVNILDTWRRQGSLFYFIDRSPYLGYECSGKVVAVGSDVSKFKEGDEVCAILYGGGGYAEFVAVAQDHVLGIPSSVSLLDAAALPRASCLTLYTLSMLMNVVPGKIVLIHEAAGDIGIIALQYAKHVGCEVFAVAGTEEMLQQCKRLGAEVCINYKKEDFCKRAKAETREKGVDIILDIGGRNHFQKNLECLAVGGSLVVTGFKYRSCVDIDLSILMKKEINVTGANLEDLRYGEIQSLISEVAAKFWPLIEAGYIKPIISKIFNFAEAADAHRALEENTVPGKLLLVPQ